MLSDVRQAALEFRTEIGRFGRDLDGKPADSRPSNPETKTALLRFWGRFFRGLGYAGENFSSPDTLTFIDPPGEPFNSHSRLGQIRIRHDNHVARPQVTLILYSRCCLSFQIQAGIDYAIAKSLAVAPFADVLWMETKTA